ncbi:MAG: nucleotidyl transferase AbiEii/AbiGii toxin family protein [Salinisphaera sp.]|jgi:predicted nucleotidyltransferase component of viral defense system|nr:nucleotidyl transferase AbiEii/AbiGii toxin family protein [Salinisphaera sp.]
MSLFDDLVDEAMSHQSALAPLRVVVEKELIHHDILREMSAAGMLAGLTFIGGTCLRLCYGSSRLSEDLDFNGGTDFTREQLANLGGVLENRLQRKYDLLVAVEAPVRETGNVDTWKLQIVTRPGQRDLPSQRINVDVCALPSHDSRPMMLRNYYGVDMGTSGLIVNAQSRGEILVDKFVALALRLKNRDLWDIAWLHQQNVTLPLTLLPIKLQGRNLGIGEFLDKLGRRSHALEAKPAMFEHFRAEMQRFLPADVVAQTVEMPAFWDYLVTLVSEETNRVRVFLSGEGGSSPTFRM